MSDNTNTTECPNCGARAPEDCDGSGEVICDECEEETGHIGCVECMFEDDDEDGGDEGQRQAA